MLVMPIWWIKSLLTTLVRSVDRQTDVVRLTVSTSQHARIIFWLSLAVMIGWLLFSSLPLVIFPTALFLLCSTRNCSCLSSEFFSYQSPGNVYTASGQDSLLRVDMRLQSYFIVFTLANQGRLWLWRDSCERQQYKHLLVMLKQWQKRQQQERNNK